MFVLHSLGQDEGGGRCMRLMYHNAEPTENLHVSTNLNRLADWNFFWMFPGGRTIKFAQCMRALQHVLRCWGAEARRVEGI